MEALDETSAYLPTYEEAEFVARIKQEKDHDIDPVFETIVEELVSTLTPPATKLLILKSEYNDSINSEDEMERQYISFDDDNVILNHEEVVTTEAEDPVETAMRCMFNEDISQKEVKKSKKMLKVKRASQRQATMDKKAPIEKSVQKFLQPRKDLPVIVTPPKKKKHANRYQSRKTAELEVPLETIASLKKVKEKPKEISMPDGPSSQVKLSFKDSNPLRCIVCQQDCANKRELIVHVKSHSHDKNSFECPICKKTFAQQCNLKRHMRCHSGERPYTCPYCQKLFSDQGYLTTHLRYHTNTKPYSCDQCKKSFFDRSNYIKHLRSHSGEKPYTCPTCSKSFLQQSDLTRHSRTHSGERPFKCNYCERAFTQHGDLTTHLRHHTGERPYSCGNCHKTFANKRYLNSHVRGHICEKRPIPAPAVASSKSKVFVGLVEVVVENESAQ